MSTEQTPFDAAADAAVRISADDALLDRLAAGEWDHRDRRDPAVAVLAAVLADLEDRPSAPVVARRTRRAAIALPLIAGLLVMPGLAAAAAVGDPWAPYRSALAPLGVGQPGPTADQLPSPRALEARRQAAAEAARTLDEAAAAAEAGDLVGARRLLAAAEVALRGVREQEIAGLLGRLQALKQILANDANGTPGGPTASNPPAPNGNANGQDEVTQTGPPPVASAPPDGANGSGAGAPAPGATSNSGVNGAGNGGPSTAATPTPNGNANGSSDMKQTGKTAG